MPAIVAIGAVRSGGDGTTELHCPSEPVDTHVRSVADGTLSAFVARTFTGPLPENVTRAMPSAPVVKVRLPTLTVAPAAGPSGPLMSNASTSTSAVEPGVALAGTRESRSGPRALQPAKQSIANSTSSPGLSSVSQSPVWEYW